MPYTPLARTPAPAVKTSIQTIEAARYAVLRRLAPCLRHHMVRFLQPISMIYDLIDHRRSSAAVDASMLYSNTEKINGYARAALDQCMDVGTWMAPDPDEVVPVGRGVQECVELMAASLNFRGYQLVNEVGSLHKFVRHDALRVLLTASFMAATDALSVPADVLISVDHSDEHHVTLAMVVQPADSGQTETYDDGYRKIVWRDVEALAYSEEVDLALNGDRLTMRFAVESPAARH